MTNFSQKTTYILIFLFGLFFLYTDAKAAFQSSDVSIRDTLHTEELTYGVVHSRYLADGPNILNIIAIDLDEPYLHFQTAGTDSLTRTTAQAKQNDRKGHRVVAAVNGDFFSFDTDWPIGNQMIRGDFVHGVPAEGRYHVAFDREGRPFLDALSFRGSLVTDDGESFPVGDLNHIGSDAETTLFNRYYGAQTPQDSEVLELILKTVDDEPMQGSRHPVTVMVDDIRSSGGNAVPEDGFVLRIRDKSLSERAAEHIARRDRVTLELGFKPDHQGITDVMGGDVRILDQGEPYSGDNEARHPRTFAAIDRDTTTLFLCTVDGRQTSSIGMSYREMADVLLGLGAWDAVNLDGGGSTTMVVRHEVVNSPSDPGGERKVANSLQLVSTAPPGEAASLSIKPDSFDLYPHESKRPEISAFDTFRNPVDVPDEIEWQTDPALGNIENGVFYPGNTDTSGYIAIRHGDIKDSAQVRVHHITALEPDREELRLEPGASGEITLFGVTDGDDRREIPLDRIDFASDGEELYLSSSGRVYAWAEGSGKIIFEAGELSATVPWTIEGGIKKTALEDFTGELSGWMSPAQTHRSQILGVDPSASSLQTRDNHGVWTFVDDPESKKDWDIRITRQLRDELGDMLYGTHLGARVYLADDAPGDIYMQLVIRDGDGQLEAGPAGRLTPGEWKWIQTELANKHFEGYLNGNGELTREENQFNGFRITGDRETLLDATVTFKVDKVQSSPETLP